jgi:hypothetical protein
MRITRKGFLLVFVLLTLLSVTLVAAQSDIPGSGWTAGIQIQNTGIGTSNIALATYDQDGAAFDCGSHAVQPGGAANFQMHIDCPVPAGFVGSAVVSGEQSMVGIVNVNNAGVGKAGGHYRGTDGVEASPNLSFPLVKHNHYGRTTTFYIQNTSEMPANISYTFAMQNGQIANGNIANIPAYAMAIIGRCRNCARQWPGRWIDDYRRPPSGRGVAGA